jgi:hypothetical protein
MADPRTADVAKFALYAHAFPAFAHAGEIDKTHRIASFIRLAKIGAINR